MNKEKTGGAGKSLVILIPIFNDWEALEMLVKKLEPAISGLGLECTLVIVNDGSTVDCDENALLRGCRMTGGVKILSLRRNLGHQRAITIGLAYVYDNYPGVLTLVMDGDGEDDPGNIPQLIEACRRDGLRRIVFAERVKRMEGIIFRLFYHLYRFFHLLATGLPVRVGNYSVIPYSCLKRLTVVSEMWNHYAAAVLQAKIPLTTIPTVRAARLTGRPKMNFVSLVIHGLSAISIFGAVTGVRLLIIFTSVLLVLLIGGVVSLLSGTAAAVSPPCAAGGLFVAVGMVLLAMLVLSVFTLLILARRTDTTFLPSRDYKYFIDDLISLR